MWLSLGSGSGLHCSARLQGPLHHSKGLSTREAGRGHATPHMPVETAKCWWLLKIEPNAWAGGKGSCAVCVDLQAVGALEFFGELCSLAKGFGPIFEGVWAGFREREGSIFSNHQHFAVSTGICGVACPLPASRVDKPLTIDSRVENGLETDNLLGSIRVALLRPLP